MTLSILVVGERNTCRSPLVEALLRRRLTDAGYDVDVASAGIRLCGPGEPADPRARGLARRLGVDLAFHRARQLRLQDFRRHAYIVAVDGAVFSVVTAMAPAETGARLMRLDDIGVGDPEFATGEDLERMLPRLARSTQRFADSFAAETSGMAGLRRRMAGWHLAVETPAFLGS